MGIPCMRLNTGRWNTIKSFDQFIKKRGQEPALPGYTEKDAFKWCIDSSIECTKRTEESLTCIRKSPGPGISV